MNTLDVIISVTVFIYTILGLKNGFLKSIFSLIGILAGLFLATKYNSIFISFLSFLKIDPKLLSIISFILIIIITYSVAVYIGGKISRLHPFIKSIDRITGAILGVFKGLIIASLFLLFTTNTFNFFSKETVEGSRFYSSVIDIAPAIYNYLVKFFPNAKNFYDELNNLLFTGL